MNKNIHFWIWGTLLAVLLVGGCLLVKKTQNPLSPQEAAPVSLEPAQTPQDAPAPTSPSAETSAQDESLPAASQDTFLTSLPAAETDAQSTWQAIECASLSLPQQTQGRLICRRSEQAFCALFEKNGQIFYCKTQDGSLSHQSNIWGSSLTVTYYDSHARPLSQRYYANAELTRAVDFDYEQNQVARYWWDEDQIRFYQEDTRGKTLNKFYFRPGKPYIQYPDGNDMGERNGTWEQKDGQIFIDGAWLCTLPQRTPAPDSCAVFAGACTAQ